MIQYASLHRGNRERMANWARQWSGDNPVPHQETKACYWREIVGNPFHNIKFDHGKVPCGSDAHKLATVIRNDYTWEAMPILGDALEEQGITDTAVLAHLRGGEKLWRCGGQGTHAHDGKKGHVYHGRYHEYHPGGLHHHHDEKCKHEKFHLAGCWVLRLILGPEKT